MDAILEAYARSVGKAPTEIHLCRSEQVLAEDQERDKRYFLKHELDEIEVNLAVPERSLHQEILVNEEALDQPGGQDRPNEAEPALIRDLLPETYGISEEMIAKDGWSLVDNKVWLNSLENSREIPNPEPDHPAFNFPWRSSCVKENGSWRLLEDEVRWSGLASPTRLQRHDRLVCVYQAKLDQRQQRQLRHFPGMRQATLEQMVRRAHEGLGHPETSRFLRILRQSKVDEEVLKIAKELKCSTCAAFRLPDPARRVAPPKEETHINERVGLNVVHLRDHDNRTVPSLNVIDWGTHFQLVIPMPAESAVEIRKAYRQWIRFFGVPRKLLTDLGTEFRAEFRRQAEQDGSEVALASVEAPTQRGLTERAGGVFKNILYKSMMDYGCQSRGEWLELVDIACMTRNRLLLRAGYSPIQRGYSPRLPGGLLSGGENDHMAADLIRIGDRDAVRAMKMRKAAAVAFHEADCDQALRAAALGGPRRFQNFEIGQAVYCWRRGAGTHKKTRDSYWHGPGRVLMTDLPNAVWISFNGTIVKAAPERVRHATPEEDLTISGWLRGISRVRVEFEQVPKKGFIDITADQDPLDDPEGDLPKEDPERHSHDLPPLPMPERRVRRKQHPGDPHSERPGDPHNRQSGPNEPLGEPLVVEPHNHPEVRPQHLPGVEPHNPPGLGPQLLPGVGPQPHRAQPNSTTEAPLPSGAVNEPAEDAEIRGEVGEVISGSGVKREGGEDQAGPPEKRSRVQLLEIYHMHLQALSKQRARKEAKFSDFKGRDAVKLQNAIRKEIDNNLRTKAYQLLSPKESRDIRNNKPEKIMESRYVFTKKPIEPCETAAARIDGVLLEDEPGEACKAKARHVMKGYSEESALDVEFTTPQVNRDSVIFVLQVIASMGWVPGFLDFTQAFHSGDEINRELYCFQPKEGIPGAHPEQILKLLKTCYGLTDGPFAWYQHLARRLQEDFGYRPSQADPCVFMLHDRECPDGPRLEGIMGIATDDLVHGGSEKHWANVAQIAREYKLGKNQTGEGRFTGKHVKLELDGSITANQDFYVKEKVHDIPLTRKRKQQRYSRCTAQEVEQLRSSLGALSWLAKETRCDLAGRVSLLQQAFPEPKVSDLVEANRIASEARKFSHLGIKIMPIPWQDLRISVVTDAAWGNTKETPWIEDNPADHWQELPDRWIRHHVQARRTTFHPGAAPGGPDLHEIASRRLIDKYTATDQSLRHEQIEDEWSDQQGIRVLQEFPWTGQSIFFKQDAKEAKPSKIHSSLVQLQNLSSQGGQIVIYHHKSLSETERPAMTTVASWKSYRLKRKTVDTLAAEGQALQAGIGSVHWHRLLSSSRPSTACCRQVTGELLHVGSHFWRP